MNNTVICTAGHRPNRLGGYTSEVARRLMSTAHHALDTLQPKEVVCGMALGWDMAIGLAALERRINVVCAIPFHGFTHESATAQRAFNRLTQHAKAVIITARDMPSDYPKSPLLYRNEWMVEHSDAVAALWCGDKHSGTWHCMNTAMKQGKPVTNFWAEWAGAK